MLADRVGFTEAKGEKSKIFVFQQGPHRVKAIRRKRSQSYPYLLSDGYQ